MVRAPLVCGAPPARLTPTPKQLPGCEWWQVPLLAAAAELGLDSPGQECLTWELDCAGAGAESILAEARSRVIRYAQLHAEPRIAHLRSLCNFQNRIGPHRAGPDRAGSDRAESGRIGPDSS